MKGPRRTIALSLGVSLGIVGLYLLFDRLGNVTAAAGMLYWGYTFGAVAACTEFVVLCLGLLYRDRKCAPEAAAVGALVSLLLLYFVGLAVLGNQPTILGPAVTCTVWGIVRTVRVHGLVLRPGSLRASVSAPASDATT